MERLMSELVNHFRNIMMAKTTRNPEKFIVSTPDELQRYKENADKMTYGTILHIMETLCREASQLKYSSHQRAQTETTLIRLCSPALSTDNAAVIRRLDELEAQLMLLKAQGVTVTVENPPKAEPVKEAPSPIKEEPVPVRFVEDIKEATPVKVEEANVIPVEEIPFDESPFEEPPVFEDIAPVIPEEKAPERVVEEKPIPAPEPKKVDTGIVTDADNAVPFAAWENALNQLSKINRPLYPMLIGSSAYRAGNTIFIKAKNTAFSQMFKQKIHSDAIAEALMRATGEKLKPMIYNDGSSPAADETAEPIDAFLAKLNKHNIDFIIEE